MVSRIGPKWSNRNGANGPILDVHSIPELESVPWIPNVKSVNNLFCSKFRGKKEFLDSCLSVSTTSWAVLQSANLLYIIKKGFVFKFYYSNFILVLWVCFLFGFCNISMGGGEGPGVTPIRVSVPDPVFKKGLDPFFKPGQNQIRSEIEIQNPSTI